MIDHSGYRQKRMHEGVLEHVSIFLVGDPKVLEGDAHKLLHQLGADVVPICGIVFDGSL